jgi:hypothetical protein
MRTKCVRAANEKSCRIILAVVTAEGRQQYQTLQGAIQGLAKLLFHTMQV